MLWIGLRRSRRRDPLRLLVPVPWLVVGAALPRRLSHRAQRRGLERHRRRLRGRHRRRPPGRRRQAVGRLPQGQRARRHLRAGDLRRLRPLRAGLPVERALGRPARRPRRVDRLRPAVPGPAVPHRPAHARADPRARARLRVGGEPVHALRAGLQRQRRARGRARPRRHRGRVVTGRRAAPSSPSRAWRSSRRWRWRRSSRLRRAAALRFVLGGALALAPCLLLVLGYGGLHDFYDRTLGFQASRGSPFSVWGLYGWDTRAGRGPGRRGAAGRRRRLRAAPARPRRALGAGRRRAHRAAARRHALVLPLHRVVPGPAAHRAAGRRRARGAPRGRRPTPSSSRSLPAPAVAWR